MKVRNTKYVYIAEENEWIYNFFVIKVTNVDNLRPCQDSPRNNVFSERYLFWLVPNIFMVFDALVFNGDQFGVW